MIEEKIDTHGMLVDLHERLIEMSSAATGLAESTGELLRWLDDWFDQQREEEKRVAEETLPLPLKGAGE